MCFCQDISDRKRTERLLIQSEHKFKSFVENAADIIYTINKKGEADYISPNCKRILGYEPEELTGNKLLDLLDPRDRNIYISDIKAMLNGEARPACEYRVRHKDQSLQWYSINFSMVMSDGNSSAITGDLADDEPYIICNARNTTLKKEYESKLEYLSMHDQLTGLFSRAYFNEEVNRREQQNLCPVSVLVFDMDDFKNINDTYGHAVGDELLISCAKLIGSSLRKDDVFARMGGDEFSILLPMADENDTMGLIKRVNQKIKAYNETSKLPPISISIGVATKDNTAITIDEIIKEADRRMYVRSVLKKGFDKRNIQ